MIITFGTANVVHNSICFGAGSSIGSRDRDIVTAQLYLSIVLHFVLYWNDSVTNGNHPQNIVSHLVPD